MSRVLLKRVVLYPKDVERLTGRKDKTARKLLNEIKLSLGKQRKDFVSVREFSQFTGIHEDDIYLSLI